MSAKAYHSNGSGPEKRASIGRNSLEIERVFSQFEVHKSPAQKNIDDRYKAALDAGRFIMTLDPRTRELVPRYSFVPLSDSTLDLTRNDSGQIEAATIINPEPYSVEISTQELAA